MDFLNGRKTVIGSILLALATWLPNIVDPDTAWLPIALMLLKTIGSSFAGVGVIHKVRKGELRSRGKLRAGV